MPKVFEFIERVNVYYSVEAETEEEAWAELDKLEVSYDSIREKGQVDILECAINSIDEV